MIQNFLHLLAQLLHGGVLIVLGQVGIHSEHIEESVVFNGRLTPSKTNWIKVQDAAMVLEEQPHKVCQAFRLFLQGQGYCLKIRKMAIQ
jgi:hypothetical protein